jgi:hypothetical protein
MQAQETASPSCPWVEWAMNAKSVRLAKSQVGMALGMFEIDKSEQQRLLTLFWAGLFKTACFIVFVLTMWQFRMLMPSR